MKRKLLLIAACCMVLNGFGQKNYWRAITVAEALSKTKGGAVFSKTFQPTAYKLFTLNENGLQQTLRGAMLRSITPADKSKLIIAVPFADGSIHPFRIAESPVMQPGLQAKYSSIRSYIGIAVNNPATRIYCDFTTHGFHAMIVSPAQKTVYINPAIGGKGVYAVFDRNNAHTEKQAFDCRLNEVLNNSVQGNAETFTQTDAKLRTYRFAVSTGGEFSKLCLNGTENTEAQKKASVLSVLVTDLVRTNGIFETDFGVHLNYVDNEDTIIFLNSKTDPFQGGTLAYFSGRWNTQAQQAHDKYIGNANYDIGHLLMGFATGGNAGCIGCVCTTNKKGSGATGFTTDLTTDPFVVDFWAHEIGHQFGGNHTFDYSNEGTIAQMEPGSGSTIMGYAGTTGNTDIQPHSDPYFHAVSIQQIGTYVTTGNGVACASISSTGNIVPLANAKKNYTIPKSTPFVLSAGGSDGNASDVLTYCWEQYDLYKNNGTSNKFPSATATTGPVFRSFDPTTAKQRYFPALPSILDGTNGNEWEVLPSVSRKLNFRLTVRDNHPGGGSTSSDDMVVDVDSTAGPFTVTVGNNPITINGGSKRTITWNVANSNKTPVNCTSVKILLSTDGGLTFPTILLSNTPNTGSAQVTMPNVNTTKGRIMVMAVGNIFFDICDANITIQATATTANNTSIAGAIADQNNNAAVTDKVIVQPNPAKSYTQVLFNAAYANCELTLSTSAGKVVYRKTLPQVTKGVTERIALSGFAKGIYFLRLTTENGVQTEKIIVE